MSTYSSQLLQEQFKSAHDWLMNTIGEADESQLHWQADGLPSPIGAQLMHVLLVEDFFVGALSGNGPLMMGDFAGKTGASEMPPQSGPWDEWGKSVQVDLAAARDYADAVFKATDAYVGSLDDEAVAEKITLEAVGIEDRTRGNILSILILNCFTHAGEISALKGLQGEKGYPF
ncbi:MAG: DinB family protein [Chloroflexi bacterium]|nr:MAG: hypothetical protein CUN54_08505 [Phototrophicales bacterium]RMF81351.1 MAG: DinB family protein [Chloroflexota bacterium]